MCVCVQCGGSPHKYAQEHTAALSHVENSHSTLSSRIGFQASPTPLSTTTTTTVVHLIQSWEFAGMEQPAGLSTSPTHITSLSRGFLLSPGPSSRDDENGNSFACASLARSTCRLDLWGGLTPCRGFLNARING